MMQSEVFSVCKKRIIFIFVFILLLLLFVFFLKGTIEDKTFCIVLDPGHGGEDPGAVSGEIYEKNINLSVALLVCEQLQKYENVVVKMTRDDDNFISLSERADIANTQGADLFVSIHANSLDDTSYAGVITFYHPKKFSSKRPAEIIQRNICSATNAINRNVRSENYAVLRETRMPAVLVETGFMTCPEELTNLINPEYQYFLALGISEGIIEYIN